MRGEGVPAQDGYLPLASKPLAAPLNSSDPPGGSLSAFVRLLILYVAAVICGGLSPGQFVFTTLLQKAGFMSELCEDPAERVCDKQFVHIGQILTFMNSALLVWTLMSGLLYDSMGPRFVGVVGALMLAFGLFLVAVAVWTSQRWLFTLGVGFADGGSLMQNFAFYGLLFHLPGWQALIIALSNGCIQVAAYLPVGIQLIMDWSGASFYAALLLYAALCCIAAMLAGLVVPSQAEYFSAAQQVLGVPIARKRTTAWRMQEQMQGGWRILQRQGINTVLVGALMVIANTSITAYQYFAKLMGTAIFRSRARGDDLQDLYLKFTAAEGLLLVPLTGMLVDLVGMPLLSAVMAVSIITMEAFFVSASWVSQSIAAFAAAAFYNFFLVFVVKYAFHFSPPDRLGTVQGIYVTCISTASTPMYMTMVYWTTPDMTHIDMQRLILATRVCGVLSVVGFLIYTIHAVQAGPIEVELEEDDEVRLMKQFALKSLSDAEEVLGLPRERLLKQMASQNALEQQELIQHSFSEEVMERYLALAHKRAAAVSASQPETIRVDIKHGVSICSESSDQILPALVDAFGGGRGERGKPSVDYLTHGWPTDDPRRLDVLQSWLGLCVHIGVRFGRALALRTNGGPIEAICICYPPGSLEDGAAMEVGSDRWLYGTAKSRASPMQEILKRYPDLHERLVTLEMAELDRKHRDLPPHWYIAFLGVVPGKRGLKRGKIFLDLVAQWARETEAPCYLECGDVNVPIYQKSGFDVMWSEKFEEEPGNSISLHGMLRPSWI